MIAVILAPMLALVIMGYGVAWMFGGSRLAGRYMRALGRLAGSVVRAIGRWIGRTVLRYPRVVGVVVLVIVLSRLL